MIVLVVVTMSGDSGDGGSDSGVNVAVHDNDDDDEEVWKKKQINYNKSTNDFWKTTKNSSSLIPPTHNIKDTPPLFLPNFYTNTGAEHSILNRKPYSPGHKNPGAGTQGTQNTKSKRKRSHTPSLVMIHWPKWALTISPYVSLTHRTPQLSIKSAWCKPCLAPASPHTIQGNRF